MRQWFTMKKADDNSAEIVIYDVIGSPGWFDESAISAKDFLSNLKDMGDDISNITLHINSPGGDVFDGVAIHNALKNHKASVTAHVDGIAASIASYIAMAADKIVMPANAFLLLHNASGFSMGTAEDMRAVADDLDRIDKSITATYASRSGQTPAKVRALLKEDRLMDAAEAKSLGYADEITKETKLAAKFSLKLLPKAAADRIRTITGNGDEDVPPITQPQIPEPNQHPPGEVPVSPVPPAPPPPSAEVVDLNAAKKQGMEEHQAYVASVTDLCTLAGSPERVGPYVRAAVPVDKVREELLALRAAEPAIMPHHPLVDQAKVPANMWTKITDKINARRKG
jgi:ATP-dependent Clp protease, protease subunit